MNRILRCGGSIGMGGGRRSRPTTTTKTDLNTSKNLDRVIDLIKIQLPTELIQKNNSEMVVDAYRRKILCLRN